jgi:hypothetical protein
MSIATGQVLQLELFASPGDWSGEFDRLEVWRSRLSSAGPYHALTSNGWVPARVPAGALSKASLASGAYANLVDKRLVLLVNEKVPVTVTFTGSDPFTFASAAAFIEAHSQGLLRSYLNLDGQVVIETFEPGLKAILRIVGGDAAPLLKLPTSEPDSVGFGRDPAIALVEGESRYLFTDPNADKSYFYRTRFLNTLDGRTSEFSAPFNASGVTALPFEALVRGTVDLVGPDGIAVANREILVFARFQGQILAEKTVAGGALRKRTDCDGHAEFLLPRGLAITVAVAGTDLVRDILVPTEPTLDSFNLLDPARGANDVFTVQRPPLEYAVRRSI